MRMTGERGKTIIRRCRQEKKRPFSSGRFFATTSRGIEPLLADELRALDVGDLRLETGGVGFTADLTLLCRSLLRLRTANRVLLEVGDFICDDADTLYRGVREIPWPDFITPAMTLAVHCTLKDSAIKHSGFAALKAKDAIVDAVRDVCGERPSINVKEPDLPVQLYLRDNRCRVYLDTAGLSLDHRGYRIDRGEAPLREHLAAAIVLMSRWQPDQPLYDPFCGSGTLLAEAAMIAANFSPGLLRQDFSFLRWPGVDRCTWQKEVTAARAEVREITVPLVGSDSSSAALRYAQANLSRLGFDSRVILQEKLFEEFSPSFGKGVVLCNPPYGERMGDEAELQTLYRQIGDVFKKRCAGCRAFVLTRQGLLAKAVGLRPSRRLPLWNGPLECRLLEFELFEGKREERKS